MINLIVSLLIFYLLFSAGLRFSRLCEDTRKRMEPYLSDTPISGFVILTSVRKIRTYHRLNQRYKTYLTYWIACVLGMAVLTVYIIYMALGT